ncbi:MAG: hypothetical protein ACTSYL_12065 [Candidatus Thorarchaeota archaeon]
MMGPVTTDTIVPMTAIRTLDVAGSTSLEQSIPEDYALASIVFKALAERDGRDIQFIIRAYLPIRVISVSNAKGVVLTEPLGLVSERVPVPKITDISKFAEQVGTLRDPQSALRFLEEVTSQLNHFDLSNDTTVPGLFSGDLLSSVAQLARWPSRKDVEPYAVMLQEAVSSEAVETAITTVRNCFSAFEAIPIIEKLLVQVDTSISEIITKAPSIIQGTISKLDDRILHIERDIEYLESRLQATTPTSKTYDEIARKLQARRKALLSDKKRRSDILTSTEDLSKTLEAAVEEFKQRATNVLDSFHVLQGLVASVVCPSLRLEDSTTRTLMFPLILIGYSRKGVLEISVVPPLRYTNPTQRAGRRRDFVDPFIFAEETFTELVKHIESRIDADIALMKFIRDSAETSNILSVKFTRRLLKDGADLLRADGLVSKAAVKNLSEFLSKFKERHLAVTDATIVTGSASTCDVRFHITDEQGQPISNALLTLGPITARSDSQGSIRLSLPRSSYSGSIVADDYKERPIEITLRNAGEFVVPVIMKPLDPEELLARSIDTLERRAERIANIRKRLSIAFEKHGDTFLNVPSYRSALTDLLREMGYDPDVWIDQAKRESGMMQRFLKGEARADDLRRVILRIGEDTHDSGGIMLFSELLVRLDQLGWHTTANEVEDVLKALTKEGIIQGLSTLESGTKIVGFVPVALTDDPRDVLTLAAKNNGQLTIEDIVVGLGWAESRAKVVLDLLVERGVAKMQRSYSRSTQYWFPGLRKKR